MNIEQEIKGLVEMIDDACNDAFEEWSMNFTERQFGDFVGTQGATQSTNFMFNAIEGAILEEALKRVQARRSK